MTRWLSEALQAIEPTFRQGLNRLEAANGHPNADIYMTTAVRQETQAKLRQLGLDPRDTTAEELYHALQERIKADDVRLTKVLRTSAAQHISAEGNVVAGMIHILTELPDSKRSFGLKNSVLRSLIKQQPPKRAMKQLGYRSLDSFLKHETPVSILSAAWLCEGSHWRQRLLDQYKNLKAGDFEDRKIALIKLDSPRWRNLAQRTVQEQKHNLLSFKELGALVFLPLSNEMPAGTVTSSLALALHELNEIRAAGTFLKLSQVRPDFGKTVQIVTADQPYLQTQTLDQPVPWHLVHRYYASQSQRDRVEAFEPHLRLEDIAWHPIEQTLASIEPSFSFWRGSSHLGWLPDGQPVSLNVIDAALNFCNRLPFEKRLVHYFQYSLWHELLLRYMHHDSIEQAVTEELQPELATERAEI